MSDDNIIEFPDVTKAEQEQIPILQCSNCGNLTWIVSPKGEMTCSVCSNTHMIKDILLDG